jgi:hypothetical protein
VVTGAGAESLLLLPPHADNPVRNNKLQIIRKLLLSILTIQLKYRLIY